jgi:hypothetical protein
MRSWALERTCGSTLMCGLMPWVVGAVAPPCPSRGPSFPPPSSSSCCSFHASPLGAQPQPMNPLQLPSPFPSSHLPALALLEGSQGGSCSAKAFPSSTLCRCRAVCLHASQGGNSFRATFTHALLQRCLRCPLQLPGSLVPFSPTPHPHCQRSPVGMPPGAFLRATAPPPLWVAARAPRGA